MTQDPASASDPDPGSAQPEGEAAGAGRSPTPLRDLAPRLISAIVMIAAALVTLLAGGIAFTIFWFAAGLAILWEWQQIVGGQRPRGRLFAGTLSLALAADFTVNLAPDLAVLVLVMGCLAEALLAGAGRRLWNAGGLLYAAALVLSVGLLRMSIFYGWQTILWLFAVVWTTDIMAYFGGRLIGGPKLWPRISPKKTWAGFCTGVICGGLAGTLVLRWAVGPREIATGPVFLLGLATAVLSQGGDLFESGFKRHFGVKDSSGLIPGHGGVMDRLDGFIAAATFAAGLGVIRAGMLAAGNGLFQW